VEGSRPHPFEAESAQALIELLERIGMTSGSAKCAAR